MVRCGSRSTPTAVRPAGGRLIGKDGSPLDLDGFKKTIEFYLTAVFNVMRLSAAAIAKSEPLEEGGRGVIVNTASIAGYEGQIGQLPYSAAKGGVLGMTLVAARDLSPLGIRVVTIAPGTFLTPAYGKAGDQLEQYWGPQVPFPKRMGRSPEYAPARRRASSRTTISTAKSSASTERCGSRRSEPAGRQGRLRRRCQPRHRRDGRHRIGHTRVRRSRSPRAPRSRAGCPAPSDRSPTGSSPRAAVRSRCPATSPARTRWRRPSPRRSPSSAASTS